MPTKVLEFPVSGKQQQNEASSTTPVINTPFDGLFKRRKMSASSSKVIAETIAKRDLQKEKSTDSKESCGETGASSNGSTLEGAGQLQNGSRNGAGKLSKIGRRLRDSCRNLRGKGNSGPKKNPEDYCSTEVTNESSRSRHYVAMDFTGKVGRIVDRECIRGYTSKDGYSYFRRKVNPADVQNLLTNSQAVVHTIQPWFHKDMSRDFAQRVLNSHNVDGAFLVRESSVPGGFVISYFYQGRTFHSQVLPDTDDEKHVFYSIDDGKTRFYDLLQMVEFYQLNKGCLNTRLTHYIVKGESFPRSESEISTVSIEESVPHMDRKDSGADLNMIKTASSAVNTDSNHNHNNNDSSNGLVFMGKSSSSNGSIEAMTTVNGSNMTSSSTSSDNVEVHDDGDTAMVSE